MSLYVVRKKLSASEVDAPDTRWDAECGCVQTTPDGGATWIDNPGADPRLNTAYQRPSLTGMDARCDAATAMRDRVKSIVDAFITTATLTGAATSIWGVISILFPPAAIVAAILALVEFFLTIGVIDVVAVMTTEVYDQLLCIFYCNADANGQLSDASFAQVYTDIEAQLPEGAIGIVERSIDIVGIVGINNAGALATETGDCTDCSCGWAAVLETCTSLDAIFTLDQGTQTGVGIVMTPGGWASGVELLGNMTITDDTVIQSIGIWFNDGGGVNTDYRLYVDSGTVYTAVTNISTGLAEVTGLSISAGAHYFYVIAENGAAGVVGLVTGVRFTGVGTNPFPDDPDVTPTCQP